MSRKTYLGDGVYAEFDGHMVILTVPAGASNNGREQKIYMEPGTLNELENFIKEIRKC